MMVGGDLASGAQIEPQNLSVQKESRETAMAGTAERVRCVQLCQGCFRNDN